MFAQVSRERQSNGCCAGYIVYPFELLKDCATYPPLPLPLQSDRYNRQEHREQTGQRSVNIDADASVTKRRNEAISSLYGKKTGLVTP